MHPSYVPVSYTHLDEPEKKLNMDLASGTEYDIVRMEPSWFDKLAAQNALLPLNDLIEQYGPNIKKYCLPELFETTTRDGKIYGIPSPTPGCGVYWGIAIRQDILDEMGLEIPTDVEQLYTLSLIHIYGISIRRILAD